MNENHPALVASRASWRCVQAHDKEGWLGLMADDVHIEDPIGGGPTNPDGKGIRGKQAVSVGGAQEIAVAAAARLQTDANREVTAAATYKLQATTVEIQATASITLMVGGSSIKIDPSGVTVAGPMIKLN